MSLKSKLGMWALGSALLCLLVTVPAMAQSPDTERMSWPLDRDNRETFALTGQRFEQGEIGGGGGGDLEFNDTLDDNGKKQSAWPVLYSLILPGAGEASMGYKRGYIMMAADILAWTQVSKYHNEGKDLTDEYIAFADEHYTDELLLEGYLDAGTDPERSGEGVNYFSSFTTGKNFNTLDDLNQLPLFVTKEDDFREYYENLGKWDQFIFGWDDYTRASLADYPYDGYVPTNTRADLQNSWVSENRESYRLMRDAANDAYETRDRWLYVNIGLRIFSVLQSAYLSGLLGGGNSDGELEVAGHTVQIYAAPAGLYRGAVAANISF